MENNKTPPLQGTKEIYTSVWTVLGWIFGFCFLVTGIWLVLEIPAMGICYFIAGILLLPPVKKFVGKKFKIATLVILYVIMSTLIIWSFVDMMFPRFPH